MNLPEDVRPDESDRYAIIVLASCSECRGRGSLPDPRSRRSRALCEACRGTGEQRDRIAYTSAAGLGPALLVLHEEEQLHGNDAIGVLDLIEHRWIINPYGKRRPAPAPANA